jgi:hypothetical protein
LVAGPAEGLCFCSEDIEILGGAEGNRTPDLCSAIAALSHLSYSPQNRCLREW